MSHTSYVMTYCLITVETSLTRNFEQCHLSSLLPTVLHPIMNLGHLNCSSRHPNSMFQIPNVQCSKKNTKRILRQGLLLSIPLDPFGMSFWKSKIDFSDRDHIWYACCSPQSNAAGLCCIRPNLELIFAYTRPRGIPYCP